MLNQIFWNRIVLYLFFDSEDKELKNLENTILNIFAEYLSNNSNDNLKVALGKNCFVEFMSIKKLHCF